MKKTYNFYPYPSTETIINQTEIKKIENYNEFNFLCYIYLTGSSQLNDHDSIVLYEFNKNFYIYYEHCNVENESFLTSISKIENEIIEFPKYFYTIKEDEVKLKLKKIINYESLQNDLNNKLKKNQKIKV